MAVSDWSTNPVNNTSINGYSLSGPYGHVFAVLMAEIKAELDSVKASVTAVDDAVGSWSPAEPARTTTAKGAIEALEGNLATMQADIGSWTDETEDTTVKAAIEALRPEVETTGD